MKRFMGKNFLLTTETARTLYHDYASMMPVIDYHCHIDPREIAEDKAFDNISQLWLGGDHYKWRLMRANGIDERYCTGDADDRDKFVEWARTLQKAVGNPLYHWSHLELQRYFDCHEPLTVDNAGEIYDYCNERLSHPDMGVRGIIKKSDVRVICTTDDPIDSLVWHKAIANDHSFEVKVLPAFRPDNAMNIEKPGYRDYISKLEAASGIHITSFESLIQAISDRIDFFDSMGCRTSDHGLNHVPYHPAPCSEIESIFTRRMNGGEVTFDEEMKFKTAFMLFVGMEYHRVSWAMQLHYGAKRDNNSLLYDKIGPNTGFDCIKTYAPMDELANYLNALAKTDQLPKTIIYSLNPADNAIIDTMAGCFQDTSAMGKVAHGAAWWFNDTKTGMVEQMTSLANTSLLANFIGMLTDSRSFLSYVRHEYFRRILCEMVGGLVENGEYPDDIEYLGTMLRDISYNNCARYFGFDTGL